MVTDRLLTLRFLTELVVVGFLTVLFGYVIVYLMKMIHGAEVYAACSILSEHYVLEKILFATGVLMYLVLEVTGVNRWNCMNMLK